MLARILYTFAFRTQSSLAEISPVSPNWIFSVLHGIFDNKVFNKITAVINQAISTIDAALVTILTKLELSSVRTNMSVYRDLTSDSNENGLVFALSNKFYYYLDMIQVVLLKDLVLGYLVVNQKPTFLTQYYKRFLSQIK